MKEIAQLLINTEAVKVSINPPFTWTSGIKSPVYCDNRILISFPQERKKITNALIEKIKEANLKPDFLAGTATAGIPWTAFLAEKLNLPMVFVRGEAKKHGTKKRIEGKLKASSKVLIIEDLISTGGSSISTSKAIVEEGKSEVLGIAAIMSWELPLAKKNFQEHNIPLITLTGFSELIPASAENGSLNQEEVKNIFSFQEDPKSWGDNLL